MNRILAIALIALAPALTFAQYYEPPPAILIDGERYDRCEDGIYRLHVPPEAQPEPEAKKPVIIGDAIWFWEEDQPKKKELPTGVDETKLRGEDDKSFPRYWVNGKPVGRVTAYHLLGKGNIPDDRTRPHLTFIGSEADRKRAIAELPNELRDRVKLSSFSPDDWRVKDLGYVTTGTPTIYLQSPSGKVLWRQDSYEGLKDFDALRKKVDEYDNKKDPGPAQPSGGGGTSALVWLGAGAALLLIGIANKNKKKV